MVVRKHWPDGSIDALIDIEAAVNDVETAVNDVETAVLANGTKLDTVNTNLGDIETDIEATNTALGTVNTNLGDIETDIEATNTALGTVNTNLGDIETDIEATNTLLGTVNTNLNNIETDVEATNTLLGTVNTNLGTIETDIEANTTLLTTIDADTSDLQAATGIHDSTAPTRIVMGGAYAETTVPTATADGDAVRPWYNEYGQQVDYGANLSEGSRDVSVVNQAANSTISNLTNLSAVTAATNGSAINVSQYTYSTVYVNVSVNTGATTVAIECSPDNTTWYEVWSKTYTATTGTDIVTDIPEACTYIRTTTSSHSSATVTTKIEAKGT